MKLLNSIQSASFLLAVVLPLSTIASPLNPLPLASLASQIRRQGALPTPAPAPAEPFRVDAVKGADIENTEYFYNWAGMVHEVPPSGTTGPYTLVEADFRIPTPTPPGNAKGDGEWKGSAWVGIDGSDNTDAILQAGVAWAVQRTGSTLTYVYNAWYEFFPNPTTNLPLDEFEVTAGNEMFVSVQSTSATEGTVVIVNTSTGQSITIPVTAPSGSQLVGKTAEWIVEDFDVNGEEVAYAKYGTIEFTSCLAQTTQKFIGLGGAQIYEMVDQNGTLVTNVVQVSSTELTVQYVGP